MDRFPLSDVTVFTKYICVHVCVEILSAYQNYRSWKRKLYFCIWTGFLSDVNAHMYVSAHVRAEIPCQFACEYELLQLT